MTDSARAIILTGGLCLAASCDATGARVTLERSSAVVPVFSTAATVAGPRLEITVVVAAEAEDGRGGRVTAPTAPRGLDVHAKSWGGRALDPVLRVGGLHFHAYSFPAKGVMRFVVDDVARLRAGDEASLQWGEDESSRVVLTRSLEVPK